MLLLLLLLSTQEPGFGGADEEVVVEEEVVVDDEPGANDFKGGASPTSPSSSLSSFPTVTEPLPPKKTKLELELEKARLDPARFPLIQLRVDVARLEMELKELERLGLTAARGVEPKLERARALLADAERIALHRMSVCSARMGHKNVVKNFRMTAGGPVRLTTKEMLMQTSSLDPDGCARIELVDQALVDRLKRAHELQHILKTQSFSYHRMAERRALEDELKGIQKELAKEDLPVMSIPGAKDPYGR